jgi:hypothetical protein
MPPKSVLLIDKKPKTIVFGHINGKERLFILCVIGVKGNTQSKVNGRSVDQGTPFLSQEL